MLFDVGWAIPFGMAVFGSSCAVTEKASKNNKAPKRASHRISVGCAGVRFGWRITSPVTCGYDARISIATLMAWGCYKNPLRQWEGKMKSRLLKAIVVVLLSGPGLLNAAGPLTHAEKPDVKVGDMWGYKIRRNPDLSGQAKLDFLSVPLRGGKTWETEWETENPRQTTRWRGKTQVMGVETVTVPAGTFQAFKLQFEGSYNGSARVGTGSWTGSRKETVWYSPEAKRMVKSQWEERSKNYYNAEVNELKSLKLAP